MKGLVSTLISFLTLGLLLFASNIATLYAQTSTHQVVIPDTQPTTVSGTLFFPMAGWHYITPVAVEFGKVEVEE